MGSLVRTTNPTAEPITPAEVRAHCRLDAHDDDDVLARYVSAATRYCERIVRKQLITATWTCKLDAFPSEDFIRLSKPPLISVTSIVYVDGSGTNQTFSATKYTADTAATPGRIILNYGEAWPTTRGQENAVTIVYVAGYGANSLSVPQTIRQAICLLAAYWYENREGFAEGAREAAPMGIIEMLLSERDYATV